MTLEVPQQPTMPPSPDRVEADRIDQARSIGDLAFAFLERHELAALLLLLALTAAFAVLRSHHKYMWFDEIFTVIVATQPTMHRFIQAMPPEGNPPLNTLLVRLCVHIFGMHELAVRLPVLVGFLGALTGLYVFVRRECGAVYGLLAIALMLAEPGWQYAYEARPYGLMLGFVMLALVSWQSAARAAEATPPRPRGLALAGMVAGILGTILSHNIGIIVIAVPLLLGEGVRLYRSRKPYWPLLATGLAAIPGLAIVLPIVHRTSTLLFTKLEPMRLTPHRMSEYLAFSRLSVTDIFDPALIFLLFVLILACWTPWPTGPSARSQTPARRIPPHSIAAAFGTLLLLPITWLAMIGQHGWFYCRYAICTLEGIAMLTCFFIASRDRNRNNLTIFLLLFLLLPFAHNFVSEARSHPLMDSLDPLIYKDASGLPIVMTERMKYPTTWWYAPPSLKGRLVLLLDEPNPPEGTAKGSYKLLETCMLAEKDLFGEPLAEYSDFIAQHDHFLLDIPDGDLPMKSTLEKAGYQPTLVHRAGWENLYDMRRSPLTQNLSSPHNP